MNWKEWHVPLSAEITVQEGLDSLAKVGAKPDAIPFVVQLFENPKYNLLPGCTELERHDIIHILLGRGLLPRDEAFVLGYTMGSTQCNKMWAWFFLLVASWIYPSVYRFGSADRVIFMQGYKNGRKCKNDLTKYDFTEVKHYLPCKARLHIGIYGLDYIYRDEFNKLPEDKATLRLL